MTFAYCIIFIIYPIHAVRRGSGATWFPFGADAGFPIVRLDGKLKDCVRRICDCEGICVGVPSLGAFALSGDRGGGGENDAGAGNGCCVGICVGVPREGAFTRRGDRGGGGEENDAGAEIGCCFGICVGVPSLGAFALRGDRGGG